MTANLIRSRFSALPLLLAATLSTGCATTYIKQTANVPESGSAPTLLASYTVKKQQQGEGSVLDAAVDAAQNAQLEEFGNQAFKTVAERLAKRGFVLELEAPRARAIDVIQIDGGAALAAMTGFWKHPETSGVQTIELTNLIAGGANRKHFAGKLYEDGKQKYFAFVGVNVLDQESFFGLWKSPEIRVHSVVISAEGQLVMESQGIGVGNGSLFFADRSPKNLLVAMEGAVAALEKAKVEELK